MVHLRTLALVRLITKPPAQKKKLLIFQRPKQLEWLKKQQGDAVANNNNIGPTSTSEQLWGNKSWSKKPKTIVATKSQVIVSQILIQLLDLLRSLAPVKIEESRSPDNPEPLMEKKGRIWKFKTWRKLWRYWQGWSLILNPYFSDRLVLSNPCLLCAMRA